jgi:signal transduction histidine kinase
MFKSLKNKIIILNMSLLTIVFVGLFIAIYAFTAIDIERDVQNKLKNVIEMKGPPPSNNNLDITILIDLDKENKIISSKSNLGNDSVDINNMIEKIDETKKNSGEISLGDSKFSFLKKQINSNNTKIALINNTNRKQTLYDLQKSFLLVGLLSLIVFWRISIYFTNRVLKPLQESIEKQERFIADASHELRTPLTIIKTNIDILKRNKNESIESQYKWIEYIDSQSNRMFELVKEMLSLATLDIQNENINFEVINLSEIIEDIILSFEVMIFEKSLTLEENIQEGLSIKGNIKEIQKLASILLDNAMKYVDKNGKITVELKLKKNKVTLLVTNTGPGIPKSDLEKVFVRFYRTDKSRNSKNGGYGLGLSIAQSIVEKHNANISVRSVVNKETIFEVDFPISVNDRFHSL